LKQQVVIVF